MVGQVAEAGAWFLVLFGIEIVWISSITVPEAVLAVIAAALCAVAVVGARKAERAAYRPVGLTLRVLLLIPAKIVADTLRLVRHLWRTRVRGWRSRGGYVEVTLSPVRRRTTAAARRAFVSIATSTSPGTYVADVRVGKRGRDVLVIHHIDPSAGSTPGSAERSGRG